MRALASTVIILAMTVQGCSCAQNSQQTPGEAAGSEATAPERPSIVTTEAELAADVEHIAERLVLSEKFTGVVLLSGHGQPLLRRAFGLADRAARRANTMETAFALASVSKMFTAVMVARLAEQNRISFNATIGSLLPTYPPGQARSQVTVHHLLTMSSGIPDLFQSPAFWAGLARIKTLSDFWPFFATEPLRFTPGTQWAYSNSNFLILGAIVERVVGVPFAAAVEQQVLRPVGMIHTSYESRASLKPARGYTRTPPGSKTGTIPNPHRWYPAWEDGAEEGDFVVGSPMGGGISTADDLTRFAEALMRGQLLSKEMTERVMKGYVPAEYGGRHGYGLETRLLNGIRILGHRGGFARISNQVDFYPDLGYVLVILGNSDASGTEEIANHVRTLITGSPVLSRPR